jgi:hypothetical protein
MHGPALNFQADCFQGSGSSRGRVGVGCLCRHVHVSVDNYALLKRRVVHPGVVVVVLPVGGGSGSERWSARCMQGSNCVRVNHVRDTEQGMSVCCHTLACCSWLPGYQHRSFSYGNDYSIMQWFLTVQAG